MQRADPNLISLDSLDPKALYARSLARYFSFFLYALSAYLIVGGTISFAAWPLDMPSWADWLGSGITIQPTASLASIASGIALLFRTRFGANRISFIFSVITFSIGAISLFQLFSGIDLGLNSLVTFEREWGRTLVVSPGQMGFPASASWTILGISLASISVNEIKRLPFSRQRLELLALAFGFAAVLVSLLSIVGYLYQVDTLFTLPRLTAIALQTATFILATGVGTVLSMTNAAPRRLLADPGTEGQVLRRLVPVVIIVPIALGHLTVLGTQSGLFEAPFGIAIRSVLEIAVLFTILILAVSAVKKQALRAAEFEVAAEERFRLAQKAGKVGVWDWKAETGETYWSDTMWELYDEEPTSKQASNIFWYERLHEDDVERVRSGVQATLNSTATEYVDEFRIVAKNGTSRWVDVRGTVERDSGGNTVRMYGVHLDVTEYKAIEDRIRTSQEKIRTITDSIPVLVAQIDDNNRFQLFNRRFIEWFGRRSGNMVGETLEKMFGDEAFEILRPAIADVLDGSPSRVEALINFPKIGPKYVEFAFTPQPRTSEEGRHYFLLINDLTERKNAEEQLRRNEEKMRVLMWSLTEHAILSTDSQGNIEAWNRGAELIFGYEKDEIIGQPIETLFTPEDLAKNIHMLEMANSLEKGHAADDRWHLRKDGTRFFASGEMTPVQVGDELIGFAKIVRDLTDAKRAAEELQKAHNELDLRVTERTRELAEANLALTQEMSEREAADRHRLGLLQRILTIQEDERGRLARDMHDQLGQRLTALRLKIESLRSLCEPYDEITRRVDRLQEISKLLDAEVSFLAWELRPAILDNMPFVDAMENYVREWSRHAETFAEFDAIGVRGLSFGKDLENNLYRITQEALNNAAKYAQATQINVLLEKRGKDLLLIIEDNGVGFDLDRVMASRDSSGGFGLSGIQERAFLVSGTVEFETGAGRGTSVFVRVPLPETKEN